MAGIDYRKQLIDIAEKVAKKFPQLVIGKYVEADRGWSHILNLQFGDNKENGLVIGFESYGYLLRHRKEPESIIDEGSKFYYFVVNPWPTLYENNFDLTILLKATQYLLLLFPKAVLTYDEDGTLDYNKESEPEYEYEDGITKLSRSYQYEPIKKYFLEEVLESSKLQQFV